jgi:hypothetical protein
MPGQGGTHDPQKIDGRREAFFHSNEKPDTGIVYILELASSISVFLLAF